MTQLGQELQSDNLSSAQQTFSSLQQIFQQFGLNGGQQVQSSSETPSSPPLGQRLIVRDEDAAPISVS